MLNASIIIHSILFYAFFHITVHLFSPLRMRQNKSN